MRDVQVQKLLPMHLQCVQEKPRAAMFIRLMTNSVPKPAKEMKVDLNVVISVHPLECLSNASRDGGRPHGQRDSDKHKREGWSTSMCKKSSNKNIWKLSLLKYYMWSI